MNRRVESLPNDVEQLKQLVVQLREEVALQAAKINHQTHYIDQLIEAIQLARQQFFGSRSKKVDTDQLSWLFNEAEAMAGHESGEPDQAEAASRTTVKGHTRRKNKGGRKKLPAHFPRIEVEHVLDDADCHCDHCQSQLDEMGQKTSEQVELIPLMVKVIKHIKKTYHCPHCNQGIKAAKLPPQPIPGSIASPGTIASIVAGKYVNGMPLYRQAQELKRLDIPISVSTLARWMIKAGTLIQPLINLLGERQLIYDIVCMDETRCQVLKESGKTPQSQSFMWVRRGGPPDKPIILFDYSPTRSRQVPVDLLDDYSGYLQVDAYDGYNKVVNDNALIRVGCWGHVMVKFKDAYKVQAKLKRKKISLALQAIHFIRALYRVEEEADAKEFTAQQRQALRQVKSKPILKKLKKWLDRHLPVVVKQSALGKTMYYMHDEWATLQVYLTDGRLRIDNNLCENAIRPFVVGRKAWLFCDTVLGAKASANLYSLVETAKANGLEPYGYLKQVFTELPKATCVEDIEALLPFKPAVKLRKAA